MPKVEWDFLELYEPVFTTRARFVDIWGGRGGGRSYFGTEFFLFMIMQPAYFRGFLVRQHFATIRTSLWADIKDRLENNKTIDPSHFHIVDTRMHITYLPNGNTIGALGIHGNKSQTGKLKSLAGATHLLMEEADEIGENDFDQISVSLRTTKVPPMIIRLFNPPGKDHWWWKRNYTPAESDVPDWFVMQPKEGVYYEI